MSVAVGTNRGDIKALSFSLVESRGLHQHSLHILYSSHFLGLSVEAWLALGFLAE
jgi:hypothetical protein